ncbi:hypothetical protein [Litorilituus lipolyticus]|uniref:Uncharacterized protein n=1 Tax=Litorilituus lipolyticus TaxID=2491017 RepID=A0A502KQR7_9GAMM|nr:hypothetical protein [Litorilituus lipolyticus]TPH14018.1 hypothetical protein EPA86_12985 [Litorilituus lipolyticus]
MSAIMYFNLIAISNITNAAQSDEPWLRYKTYYNVEGLRGDILTYQEENCREGALLAVNISHRLSQYRLLQKKGEGVTDAEIKSWALKAAKLEQQEDLSQETYEYVMSKKVSKKAYDFAFQNVPEYSANMHKKMRVISFGNGV